MKTFSILLISSLLTVSAIAQSVSTVTINVKGTKTDALILDGKEYAVTKSNNSNANAPIIVSNLPTGQHTLQVRRNNQLNVAATVFTVRPGYDMSITVTANGSVQLKETKWKAANSTAQYMNPMSDADFTTLYNSVRNRWGSANRMKLISDAFANTSNYFTTAQARQLIQVLNNQGDRFTLAKAAYRSITDPLNFTEMNTLFTSQSYRDQLADYVSNYNAGSSSTAMTAGSFNTIFRTAQRQSTTNSKVSYIYNAFTNTNNYFTVSQARQLVQLVPDETNRLYLAKVSFRSIVDKNNFSQMNTVLNNQSSRSELNNFVTNYDNDNAVVISDPVYTKVAMKETDFNVLYRDVENRFGLGAKMSALENIFLNENYYFTVAQARQLIQLVSSESNRLELAKSAYNNIVDQAYFNQLYDVLSSTASRNELDAYVRNFQTSGQTSAVYARTPMSTTSFNDLYNDVRNTWGFGAKMSELTKIFENESYYFTVAQAKQLIQLVSAESNRLQLAKSAYGNITDPENFNLIYDVLTSQSSKNELSDYVNSYSYNR